MADPTDRDPTDRDPTDHERWAADVGPYVLGALDPAARAGFETHLQACATCRAEAAALAELPVLLDRVPADVVDGLARVAEHRGPTAVDAPGAGADEPPPLLLADLLRVARREERVRARRRRVVGALAAAAVVVVLLVLPGSPVALPWGVPGGVVEPEVASATIELSPVADTPVTATVRLDDVAWGTRIDLVCRHSGASGGAGTPGAYGDGGDGPARAGYALVLRDGAGGSEQVATWAGVADDEVTVPASTLMRRGDIVAVELVSTDGTVLLAGTP